MLTCLSPLLPSVPPLSYTSSSSPTPSTSPSQNTPLLCKIQKLPQSLRIKEQVSQPEQSPIFIHCLAVIQCIAIPSKIGARCPDSPIAPRHVGKHQSKSIEVSLCDIKSGDAGTVHDAAHVTSLREEAALTLLQRWIEDRAEGTVTSL